MSDAHKQLSLFPAASAFAEAKVAPGISEPLAEAERIEQMWVSRHLKVSAILDARELLGLASDCLDVDVVQARSYIEEALEKLADVT